MTRLDFLALPVGAAVTLAVPAPSARLEPGAALRVGPVDDAREARRHVVGPNGERLVLSFWAVSA